MCLPISVQDTLLLPVGKSRISDLRSKILTLGNNKLKQALFVFPLA